MRVGSVSELSIPLNDLVGDVGHLLFEIVQLAIHKINEKGKIRSGHKQRLIEHWNQMFQKDENAFARKYALLNADEAYLFKIKFYRQAKESIYRQENPCCFSFCRPTYYQISEASSILTEDGMETLLYDELQVPSDRLNEELLSNELQVPSDELRVCE